MLDSVDDGIGERYRLEAWLSHFLGRVRVTARSDARLELWQSVPSCWPGLIACAVSGGAERVSPTRRTATAKSKAHARSERPAAAPSEPVIELAEESGISRHAWPICIGVPFPNGALPRRSALQVVGDRGALPTQVRTLASWPDGSIRWALVDFEADLSAHQRRRFQLKRTAAPAPRPAVTVRETNATVSVDTGALRFSVPKRGTGILHAVFVAGHRIPVQPLQDFLEGDGKRSAAQTPESVTVEERGPVRAAILLKGRYANGFEYRIRLEAFAGQSYVRLLHTFIDSRDAPFTMLDRIALEIPIEFGKSPRYEVGRDRKPRSRRWCRPPESISRRSTAIPSW